MTSNIAIKDCKIAAAHTMTLRVVCAGRNRTIIQNFYQQWKAGIEILAMYKTFIQIVILIISILHFVIAACLRHFLEFIIVTSSSNSPQSSLCNLRYEI